jgi:hypothetical protein
MRVEYLWFNDICLRNITMLRIPFKTRLRAFVRKFSPFRAPPHEVVIRGISQDYFGRQMNASLSPLSTLRLEIAVRSSSNQRERARWNILETLIFILFQLSWPLIFAVWCGMEFWIFGRVRRVFRVLYRNFERSVLYFSHIIWWEKSLHLSPCWRSR